MENNETKGFPLIGDKLPEMAVQTTQGIKKLPHDYAGKWLVLFSHPADFTPVCTTEFVSFAKNYDKFKKLNAELLGLSIDQVFSHIKWIEWIENELKVEIPFPIIADDQGRVAARLGMIHPGGGTKTVRAVFIVDPESIIRLILFYPAEVGRNMSEILRILEAFQISDKYDVSLPANWPDNELIKDHGIIPAPTDVKGAKERKNQNDCFDWWFCHKKV
ncbi:MAG: peroxiredoxin [Candidatus Saccharicenans sp.]|jgi:peroxiredoxin (alkyl hydroperoxide reductase subunit C)|nr:peroxiredoxin [Candidatus Saccharicenans sp.]